MQRFLRAWKFWKYITGDAQPPHLPDDVDDASYAKYQSQLEDWDNNNSKIITWFANTSVPSIHSLFTPFETAKESGQTLTDFYSKMSNLWNYLAQFERTWTCSTDATTFYAYAYRDHSRLRHFLIALPSNYERTWASLFHRHPLPTIGQAIAELRFEETSNKTMVFHQHSQPILATAFLVSSTTIISACSIY
ncbi:hypothetical protein Acr_00g0041900 [Actinidia rufa]|uniref:Uncharacterized protein n=1 Tax=Actinidia rufa TaxID=165716 RepID=A0A7J0DI78_9ERIC|nr:hypothetical protein Acr_00g0041900 [Actinidia rufa]